MHCTLFYNTIVHVIILRLTCVDLKRRLQYQDLLLLVNGNRWRGLINTTACSPGAFIQHSIHMPFEYGANWRPNPYCTNLQKGGILWIHLSDNGHTFDCPDVPKVDSNPRIGFIGSGLVVAVFLGQVNGSKKKLKQQFDQDLELLGNTIYSSLIECNLAFTTKLVLP